MGVDRIGFNMWKTVYDSVMGTSHEATGIPCQDACRVRHLTSEPDALLVVCCADGAGSASHAAEGAEIACDTFVQIVNRECQGAEIAKTVDRDTVLGWCRELRDKIESRANELAVETRQLASTFLGSVIGQTTVLFIQIGDGAIVTWDGDEYRPVFWPQSGEFANTTNFLTDAHFEESLECSRWDQRVDELAIFSDGLERLALRFIDQTVHEPFLSPFFTLLRETEVPDKYFEPLRSFLDSPMVNERTDDDKTLILATRLSEFSNDDAVR